MMLDRASFAYAIIAIWFTIVLVIAIRFEAPLGVIVPIGWFIGASMSRIIPDGRPQPRA